MTTTTNNDVHKKLGYTRLESTEITLALDELLCGYQLYYQKLRNFHWNVKGRDFFELHEKFEDFYNDAHEHIDEIAERIRVYGKTPSSNFSDYLKLSKIKESPTELSAEFMARHIVSDIETLLSLIIDVHETSAQHGDIGTAFMMNNLMKSLEKKHWQLSSWLHEGLSLS